VFVNHAVRLVSISSTIGALLELALGETFGDELGEAIYLPDRWINGRQKTYLNVDGVRILGRCFSTGRKYKGKATF
jgi:hypothetical protein